MKRKLTVGDQLYFFSSVSYLTSCDVTVVKVGHKWATLSNGQRIELGEWVDKDVGYPPVGRCYENIKEYQDEVSLRTAWDTFRGTLPWCPPKGMTLADITSIKEIIGKYPKS